MGTVSELAAAGKPAILVPLPTASDQHQLRNAEAFAKAGAGILVLDAEMTGDTPGGGSNPAGDQTRNTDGDGKAARKFAARRSAASSRRAGRTGVMWGRMESCGRFLPPADLSARRPIDNRPASDALTYTEKPKQYDR